MNDDATFNRRIHGIVVASLRNVVEAGICSILGDGYVGCLSKPLSPTGEQPPTHFGGSAQTTISQRDKVAALMNPSVGVYGFRGLALAVDDESVPYCEVWPELPDAPAEEIRWSFEAACDSLGLKPCSSVDDEPQREQ